MKLKRITPYATLGLGGVYASASGKSSFTMNIPMGVGVKYKLKERLNLGFEFTMRKAFGDKLDGLSDLNGVKSSFGKNTDWSSLAMFTITYEFSKRCRTCHYVD
jgi:opacity protein-like surface antigen